MGWKHRLEEVAMRPIIGLSALALAFALVIPADGYAAGNRYGKQKVVYHINYDGDKGNKAYLAAMGNIQNHINAVGAANMDVKVVLHGDGLYLLREARSDLKLQGRVTALRSQNVKFQICNNTLVSRKIDFERDLHLVFEQDVIPSGVAELSHLQAQGYTYIKP
jgi:uncharacterized protein